MKSKKMSGIGTSFIRSVPVFSRDDLSFHYRAKWSLQSIGRWLSREGCKFTRRFLYFRRCKILVPRPPAIRRSVMVSKYIAMYRGLK